MVEHEYESVDQLRGSVSQATRRDPAAFERANYLPDTPLLGSRHRRGPTPLTPLPGLRSARHDVTFGPVPLAHGAAVFR